MFSTTLTIHKWHGFFTQMIDQTRIHPILGKKHKPATITISITAAIIRSVKGAVEGVVIPEAGISGKFWH